MYVSTRSDPSLLLLPPRMSASEFFDAILCTSSFNYSVFPCDVVYRSPGATPEEDDSHLIRALNFVLQLESECLKVAPNIDWNSQTCSMVTGFGQSLFDTFDLLLLH